MSGSSVLAADYDPIPLTPGSFNQDIVVENTAPGPVGQSTQATMDGGTNNTGRTYYEIGYNTLSPTTGIPAPGTPFNHQSIADHTYTMAPSYTEPNAILITPPAGFVPTGSLEGSTLSSCSGCGSSSLSFPLTPVNTSAGSSVSIAVPGPGGITVTFTQVSDAGATWSNGPFGPETMPSLPTGYSSFTARIYEIRSTAEFTAPIDVCVTYDPANFADAATVELLHHDGSAWSEVTTNNAGGIVCGDVSDLGNFAVAGIGETLI